VAPTGSGSGGGLLLLKVLRLEGVVVVHITHLLLHVPVVVLDAGLPVVVVPLLLLLELMLNLKINFFYQVTDMKKNLMDPKNSQRF
jgi:hypothetical protein